MQLSRGNGSGFLWKRLHTSHAYWRERLRGESRALGQGRGGAGRPRSTKRLSLGSFLFDRVAWRVVDHELELGALPIRNAKQVTRQACLWSAPKGPTHTSPRGEFASPSALTVSHRLALRRQHCGARRVRDADCEQLGPRGISQNQSAPVCRCHAASNCSAKPLTRSLAIWA